MFRILLILSVVIFSSSSYARHNRSITKDSLIEQVEVLGDEVADFDHSERSKRKAYYKLSFVKKALTYRGYRSRIRVPRQVSDQQLMDIMQEIVTKLEDSGRISYGRMFYIKWMLNYSLRVLKRSRVASVDPAVIELSGSDPFIFGGAAGGTSPYITFTLTNTGETSATNINETTLDSPFQSQNDCGAELAPSASCTVTVQFFAPLNPGVYTSNLTLEYFNGSANQSIEKEIVGNAL